MLKIGCLENKQPIFLYFCSIMKHILFIIGLISLVLNVSAQDEEVVFSQPGGFYEDSFSLVLSSSNPQNSIRFTTNGNCPTAQSQLYTEPLQLDESLYSKSDIFTIQIAPDSLMFYPDSVRHCIVIRAAVFDDNGNCLSDVATNSYFIRALGCDTHGLPAISLCADSLGLFDYYNGILVPGVHYDPHQAATTGNYYMTGDEWERRINFEFYELNNSGINQQAGLRTHGKKSRRHQQKGLKLYAREEYGKKRFKHQFFEDIPNNNFKHLTLKGFDSSWSGLGFNDYVCGRIAQNLDVESLASRATLLFLNGESWGIYFLEERPDERYLEDHFGVDIDNVNIMNDWDGHYDCGSANNFLNLFNWLEGADLANPEDYAYFSTKVDIDNFIDYQLFEIFINNLDWPANNVRFWQLGDGIMRWIFFDGDGCLETLDFDAFANAVYDGDQTYPSSSRATLFFRKLLENNDFRDRFNSRFNELVQSEFDYASTSLYFNYMHQKLEPSVPQQIERFGRPSSMELWLGWCTWHVDNFLHDRPSVMLEELLGFLSVEVNNTIGFSCFPNPSNGDISIRLDNGFAGPTEIEIHTVMGQKVFSKSCDFSGDEELISIHPNLTAGVYFMKIGNMVQRIIRQ